MPEPIIFIAQQKIKPGKVEEYKKYYQEVAAWMDANKPQTFAHVAYVSEDGTEASVVHIFPDAEAMDMHMQGLGDLGTKAFTLMEIIGFDVYGTPSKMVLESMLKMVGPGAKVNLKPQPAGGYIRLGSAGTDQNSNNP
jgi:quinol monooxygenase YgiN